MSRGRIIGYVASAMVIAIVAVAVLRARRGMDDELVRDAGLRLVERLDVPSDARDYVRGLFPAAHEAAFARAYALAPGSASPSSLDWPAYAGALLDAMARAAREGGAGHVAEAIEADAGEWKAEGYPVELAPG